MLCEPNINILFQPARMGGKILLDITAAERIVKKTRTITDWAHPVAASVAPMVECIDSALQQETVVNSQMKMEVKIISRKFSNHTSSSSGTKESRTDRWCTEKGNFRQDQGVHLIPSEVGREFGIARQSPSAAEGIRGRKVLMHNLQEQN